TASHVLMQLQILMFSAAAFFFMLPLLKRTETITLDTDWFYRKGADVFVRFVDGVVIKYGNVIKRILFVDIIEKGKFVLKNPAGLTKVVYNMVYYKVFEDDKIKYSEYKEKLDKIEEIKIVPHIGDALLWVMIFLFFYLVIYYISVG
ncbi:MAG: Na+/H+ antiporter subunit D, partial [Calditerrivibrio sp.]|nr:Na+/H+ antiporter subunit D [Calditerrivibrio sp.]